MVFFRDQIRNPHILQVGHCYIFHIESNCISNPNGRGLNTLICPIRDTLEKRWLPRKKDQVNVA